MLYSLPQNRKLDPPLWEMLREVFRGYNDTTNISEVRNGTWLIPVRSVRRMFRCAVEDSGENAFTLLSEQQAEVGEGMMMISYGYSGAGKTTTLPPA